MFAALEFWDFFWIIWIVMVFSGWVTAYSYARPTYLRRLRRVEGKLDLLLKHFNLEYVGPSSNAELAAEVKILADHPNKKIAAIKLHRELTGAGLKEAKDAVEQYLSARRP